MIIAQKSMITAYFSHPKSFANCYKFRLNFATDLNRKFVNRLNYIIRYSSKLRTYFKYIFKYMYI